MRVAAVLVVGDHHVRAELSHHLDQFTRRDLDRHGGEDVLRQRRGRVALRQPGVDEAQPAVLNTEDLRGLGHLGAADLGQVLDHLRPVHGRVEDAARLPTGTGDHHHFVSLGHVTRGRRGSLAGLVIRVRMHRHQPQLVRHRSVVPSRFAASFLSTAPLTGRCTPQGYLTWMSGLIVPRGSDVLGASPRITRLRAAAETDVERLPRPVTNQQIPQDRYGSRARTRPRPVLRWLLTGIVLVALVGVAIVGYRNLGSAPIQGKQVAFDVLDDHSVRIVLEVQRDDPRRPADCVVRARAESGEEVGRKEVLIRPADGTATQDTVLRTSTRATIGEVYGCTYNVPEYLSTHPRPTG